MSFIVSLGLIYARHPQQTVDYLSFLKVFLGNDGTSGIDWIILLSHPVRAIGIVCAALVMLSALTWSMVRSF
jgi:hypothetical protein